MHEILFRFKTGRVINVGFFCCRVILGSRVDLGFRLWFWKQKLNLSKTRGQALFVYGLRLLRRRQCRRRLRSRPTNIPLWWEAERGNRFVLEWRRRIKRIRDGTKGFDNGIFVFFKRSDPVNRFGFGVIKFRPFCRLS